MLGPSATFIEYDAQTKRARLKGFLDIACYQPLKTFLETFRHPSELHLDFSAVSKIDLSVAYLLDRCTVAPETLKPEVVKIFSLVKSIRERPHVVPQRRFLGEKFFEALGKRLAEGLDATLGLMNTLGVFVTSLKNASKDTFLDTLFYLNQVCFLAIPIIMTTSFVVGLVLCYEGIVQLSKFGAENSVVTLISYSVLREAGALVTGIVLSGRSGSAFAAEIGAMKANEELDALKIMGIEPWSALLVPRILALIIAMPILTFIADFCGILGGGVICLLETDMTLGFFFSQVQLKVSTTTFLVGLFKAPIFGLFIGLIGCMQGLRIRKSAASIGRHTTIAVVQAIFTVILLNSIISVAFSYFRVGG